MKLELGEHAHEPLLPAHEELQAHLALRREGAEAPEVPDHAQALRQLDRRAQAREQLLEEEADDRLGLVADHHDDREVARGEEELVREGLEVQRLVEVAVAHAGVHQLRQLQELHQRRVLPQHQLVALPRRRDRAGLLPEALAAPPELRERALQPVQRADRARDAIAHLVEAAGRGQEALVVAHANLLRE